MNAEVPADARTPQAKAPDAEDSGSTVAALRGYPAEQADMNVSTPPFNYNPSAWSQRVPICLLACVAFLLATHMAMFQWGLIADVWDPVFGKQSEKVLTSNVAKKMDMWIGIPDAGLGALAYLGDAIFGLAGSTRRWQYRPWMVVLFGIDVIPLGIVSAVLVVLQGTVVGQWCLLCLITAVISLILVYMAYDEVYISLKFLWRVFKQSDGWTDVWAAFWGRPTELSERIAAEMVRPSQSAR